MKLINGCTALIGASAVALGAFGAHGLHDQLVAAGRVTVWEKAVLYHLVHAVALFSLSLSQEQRLAGSAGKSHPYRIVALCWIAGIVLFSGSLYALSLGGPSWLGPITPLGGVALIAGWFLVAFVRRPSHP